MKSNITLDEVYDSYLKTAENVASDLNLNKIENETKVIIEPNEPVQTKEETKNTEEKEVENNKEQAGKNTSEEAHKADSNAKESQDTHSGTKKPKYSNDELRAFWNSISVDENGVPVFKINGEYVKNPNLKLIQKNGEAYIYNPETGKTYDKNLNYYQNGAYYDSEGKLIKELDSGDYIDVESKDVEEKPQQQSSNKTIESNKPIKTEETKPPTKEKETKKKEAKETSNNSTSTEKPNTSNSEPTKEPSIDVNNTRDVRTTKPIYTTNAEPKINTKVIGKEAKEALEKGVEKHLKGAGIIATAALVGGLFIHHEHEKRKENRNIEPDYLTGSNRRKIFWNQSNTARLAKDVSSYRYGSRMSGYV